MDNEPSLREITIQSSLSSHPGIVAFKEAFSNVLRMGPKGVCREPEVEGIEVEIRGRGRA